MKHLQNDKVGSCGHRLGRHLLAWGTAVLVWQSCTVAYAGGVGLIQSAPVMAGLSGYGGSDCLNKIPRLPAPQAGKDVPVLRLADALYLAWCQHPDVRLAQVRVLQEQARLGQVRSTWYPQVRQNVFYEYGRQQHIPHDSRHASLEWNMQWRLWDAGIRSAQEASAHHLLRAAAASQRASHLHAVQDVLHRYIEAQVMQGQVRLQQEMYPLLQRSLLSAQRRQREGVGSRSDWLLMQAAVARHQLDMSRAQGEYELAKARLSAVIGLDMGQDYRVEQVENGDLWGVYPAKTQKASGVRSMPCMKVGESGHTSVQALRDIQPQDSSLPMLGEWLHRTGQHHPAIEAAWAQWQAALAGVQVARAEWRPTLDIQAAYTYRHPFGQQLLQHPRHGRTVRLVWNIPLFDGWAATYRVRAAQAEAQRQAIAYQMAYQQTLQQALEVHAQTRTSWRNWCAAAALLQAADAAAQSAQRQFHAGIMDVLQLNQTLVEAAQARQAYSQALGQWLRALLEGWIHASVWPVQEAVG